MKLAHQEKVAGTQVTIGKRVVGGTTYSTYNAEYTDLDGKRKYPALKTRNKSVARRRALEIQARLDQGKPERVFKRMTIRDLTAIFMRHCEDKQLAPTTLAKYRAEIDKLNAFSEDEGIRFADQFTEEAYYRYRRWLGEQVHKQQTTYAGKTLYTTLTVCKQVFKHAWKHKLLPTYELSAAQLPSARPEPQPCPTTKQVEAILEELDGVYRDMIAVLAYTGLRVGELLQLRWGDVLLDKGELGMLHIRRGGSTGSTKNKKERFVPIHPRVRPIFDRLDPVDTLVFPRVRDRVLLSKLKNGARRSGFIGNIKVHSMRHHFASMCANSRIPYRMALAWMGHSSSTILNVYCHLHDEESENAMRMLASDK